MPASWIHELLRGVGGVPKVIHPSLRPQAFLQEREPGRFQEGQLRTLQGLFCPGVGAALILELVAALHNQPAGSEASASEELEIYIDLPDGGEK